MKKKTPRPVKKSHIPKFSSLEEEAKFWNSHDLADYWDEFKPVKVWFAKNLSHGLTIRLDAKTLTQLRSLAYKKGVGPTTLARMWILENLKKIPLVSSAEKES